MRYIIDNRSSLSDSQAAGFVANHADRLIRQPSRRATLSASYGWKRYRTEYRRNRVVPSFTVYDVEGA